MNAADVMHRRGLLRVTVLLAVGVVLVTAIAASMGMRSSVRRAAESLQAERDQLKAMADELAAAKEQANLDTDLILNLFTHCRSAEDIPDLGGEHIIAARKGSYDLCFFVPEGTHTLEISSSWNLRRVQSAADGEDSAAPQQTEQTWSVTLEPSAGYWLKVASGYRGEPLRWELTSNNGGFAPRGEVILERFSGGGLSWTGSDKLVFPSQIQLPSMNRLDMEIAQKPPTELMNLRLHGKVDGQSVDVAFAIKLQSAAPACVSASDAQRLIILGREDVLLPYQGGGKYVLKSLSSP